MNDDNIIQSGPLKGTRIELASQTGIELFEAIAEDFMRRIFGFDPGDYLITDESSLSDFNDEKEDLYPKIQAEYGLDVSDLRGGYLLDIFVRIHDRES